MHNPAPNQRAPHCPTRPATTLYYPQACTTTCRRRSRARLARKLGASKLHATDVLPIELSASPGSIYPGEALRGSGSARNSTRPLSKSRKWLVRATTLATFAAAASAALAASTLAGTTAGTTRAVASPRRAATAAVCGTTTSTTSATPASTSTSTSAAAAAATTRWLGRKVAARIG